MRARRLALFPALALVCFSPVLLAAPVPVLDVSDTINVGTAEYITEGIEKAGAGGAPYVIIRLDTEGGTLAATRTIVKAMLASPVPVVVFVHPAGGHATSAGTFLVLAADVAAMAPGTHLGAAHPVLAEGKMDPIMNEKATSDTAAFAETLAKAKGRNAEWARLSVEKSASLVAKDAKEKNVVDLVASDLGELLAALKGRRLGAPRGSLVALPDVVPETETVGMTLKQRLLSFFSHPQIALWLLSLGALGIWVELTHPGLIFPGVVGGVCVILSLVSLQMMPVHYGALGLVLLGMALMVAEVFVTSFGLLGLGGLLCFVFGSLFLIDTTVPGFQITLADVVPMAGLMAAALFTLAFLVYKSRRASQRSGVASLVGAYGSVREPVSRDTAGKVFVFGELWNAVTDLDSPLPRDAIVVVKEVRDMLLVVAPQAGSGPEPRGS